MIKKLSIAFLAALSLSILLLTIVAASPSDQQEAARLNNIGVAYMNQQLFEKGLKAFEEAAAKDPNLKVTTLNRGVAMLNLQRIDEAKTLLLKAAQDDPKDPHVWYNLGLFYKNTDSAQTAVESFQRVTELDPNDADSWYFLGSTHAQIKQYPEAIDAFEHALKVDPLHASAQFGLSRSYQQSGQADKAREGLKKFQYITQNKLGTPISLAYGEQGKYSRAEESPVAIEKVGAPIPLKFVDVTRSAGLVTKYDSSNLRPYFRPGACFLDYDNDGQIDIFFPDNGGEGGMSLYRNLGGGKFEDVTKIARLDATTHAIGCTTGDYDNDGFMDIVVSFADRVLLLHNEKNGTFKDATASAGISTRQTGLRSGKMPDLQRGGWTVGVTLVDYDHDGDLDLYVTQERPQVILEPGNPLHVPLSGEPQEALSADPIGRVNQMWRNNGDGTFTDVTDQTGLSTDQSCAGAVGTDFNNDRAVDIVATGYPHEPTIFENPREGKFPARHPWTPFMPSSTVGLAVLDFDHDGWMDIAFTHVRGPALTLWRNDKGKFEPVTLPETNWVHAFGVSAIDYDNDGWVDLAALGETKEGNGEVRLFPQSRSRRMERRNL